MRVHGRHPEDARERRHARPCLQRLGEAHRPRPRRPSRGLPRHPGAAHQPLPAHIPRGDDPDGDLHDRHDELHCARAEDPDLLHGGAPPQRDRRADCAPGRPRQAGPRQGRVGRPRGQLCGCVWRDGCEHGDGALLQAGLRGERLHGACLPLPQSG